MDVDWKLVGGVPRANAWRCERCSTKDLPWFVRPNKDTCGGKPGEGGCGCKRKTTSTLFCNTKVGRAIAEKRDQSNGKNSKAQSKGGGKGGGQGGGGKGGNKGGGGDAAEKLRKSEAERKRLDARIRKLEAEKADKAEQEDVDEEDEEMDDEFKSKEQLEDVISQANANEKHATAMLKQWPKSTKFLRQQEEAKAEAENARRLIQDLRSPAEQLQHKLNREKKLNGLVLAAREQIKAKLLVVLEAEEEIEAVRERLHDWQDELQRIASQKVALVATPAAPPQPMDMGQCVETMRAGLGEMFDDPRMSEVDRAKKAEVEAGFVAMRNIFSIISGVQMAYDNACKASEATSSDGGGSMPANATGGVPGNGTESNKVAAETTEAGSGTEQGGGISMAPAVVAEPVPAAAPAQGNVPDGPASERAGRDRTPPPSSDKRRALAKITDAEIAGARKARGAAAKGKAGTKSTD